MKLVTSYINPDLDGVACAIGYSTYLSNGEFEPRFAGILNAETTGVLGRLGISNALLLDAENLPPIDEVVLVDCHHPAQLPHLSDLEAVTVIIDHHPDGDPGVFPCAAVQNEEVGAAATLVAEHIDTRDEAGVTALKAEHAALLACAIASNTLDFAAPSTTDRDRTMFKTLVALAKSRIAVPDLLDDMRAWRSTFLTQSTDDAVRQDVKIMETAIGYVAVSQLEGGGASQLLDRPDLLDAVERLGDQPDVAGALLSLVDTTAGTTTLLSSNGHILNALRSLSPEVIGEYTLRLSFIALRKTHIIPALRSAQASHGADS